MLSHIRGKFLLKVNQEDWDEVYRHYLHSVEVLRIPYKVSFINNNNRGRERYLVFVRKR